MGRRDYPFLSDERVQLLIGALAIAIFAIVLVVLQHF
jgi:hypothetical protein